MNHMHHVWKIVRIVWEVLISALLMSVVANLLYDLMRGAPVSLSGMAAFISYHWRWILPSLVFMLFLSLWSWLVHQRYVGRVAMQQIGLWKLCTKLTPQDLFSRERTRTFHSFYLPRTLACEPSDPRLAEITLRECAQQGNDFVLLGRPGMGKTRTIWEVLRILDGYWALRPNLSLIRQPILSFVKGKKVVLLLDDLQNYYGEIGLDLENFRRMAAVLAQSLCVVSTCREGPELGTVETSLVPGQRQFYDGLKKFRLVRLTETDEEQLLLGTGLPKPGSFDGTPAHIILGRIVEDMKLRYMRHLSVEDRTVLKALKLLYSAGIIPYYQQRVKAVAVKVFGLSIPPYQWQYVFEKLNDSGFLLSSALEDPLDPEPAYLETVVTDYLEPTSDLPHLGEALFEINDWTGLFYLAVRTQRIGNLQQAQQFYIQALGVKPDFAEACYNLGILFSTIDKDKSEDYYRQALRARWDYAEAHLNLGILLRQRGKNEEAQRHYGEALRLRPDYAEAHHNFAILLSDAGKGEEAIAHYREALRLQSDMPEAHCNLAILLWNTSELAEAEQHFREALRLRQNFPEAHHNLGLFLWANRKSHEAQEHLQEALRLKADYPEAHNSIGIFLLATKGVKKAEPHFLEALRLRPDYPQAHNNLGTVLRRQKLYQQAEEHYIAALSLKPDYPEAHNGYGILLYEVGRILESDEHLREALRLRPDYSEARYHLALVSRAIEEKNAEERYRETISLRPDNAEAHCGLGRLLHKSGKNKEAEEHLREAIRIHPFYPEAISELWSLLKATRRRAEAQRLVVMAQSDYEERLRLKPDDYRLHAELGVLLLHTNNISQAEKYLRKAAQLDISNPEAHFNLGTVLRGSGKFQEAAEHLQEAIRLKPDYFEAQKTLSKVLRNQRKRQEKTQA
jgi:tetratricopeptide (TPR) repeat protein